MKRIFTTALVILVATAAVQAQTDSTSHRNHAQHNMQKGSGYKDLNLTADQQAKLKTLREDFRQKHEALKAQNLSEAERKTQMQALQQEHETAMDAILTPGQKEQLAKMKRTHAEGMGNGKSWNSDSSRTHQDRKSLKARNKDNVKLQKELGLTSEQQEKMKSLRADFKTRTETLRNDQTLTTEQKRAKMQELRRQQQEQMKTVLTKEQLEKMQSLRRERKAPDTK